MCLIICVLLLEKKKNNFKHIKQSTYGEFFHSRVINIIQLSQICIKTKKKILKASMFTVD